MTRSKGSAAISYLKNEWQGSPLIQEEKYQKTPVKKDEMMMMMMAVKRTYAMCKEGQIPQSTVRAGKLVHSVQIGHN
jgi:hypothetical protein